MQEKYAKLIVENSTKAIELMTEILHKRGLNDCSDEEFEKLSRTIGVFIGELQVEIIDTACKHYPHLDTLT